MSVENTDFLKMRGKQGKLKKRIKYDKISESMNERAFFVLGENLSHVNTDKMKKRMLLHSCCGPCSTAVLEKLREDYDITLFFYNPNITDRDEYLKRKNAQLDVIAKRENFGVEFLEGDYEVDEFYEAVCGLEGEKEGGARCSKCFELRLKNTAEMAKKLGINIFSTTLSVSPHKDIEVIRSIGSRIANETGVEFHAEDYKKKAGFQRSVALSKEYGIYRQNYCGCKFSKCEE